MIEHHFEDILAVFLTRGTHPKISNEQLIQILDLTLLDETASVSSLSQLYDAAKTNHVAALCVALPHLNHFQKDDINLATVINFPHGHDELPLVLNTIDNAMKLGAHEIDYVFPYQTYLAGNKQYALTHCNEVAKSCKKNGLLLKIIIESGAFPDINSIYEVSKELLSVECNFLKTSTGKISKGASLPAVFAILSAIKDYGSHCGIKISGGIKTPEQAYSYAHLAEFITGKKINKTWFRIGASTLLESILTLAPITKF